MLNCWFVINDFDLYFTDKETIEAVANYYVKWFNTEHNDKIKGTVTVEDDRVKILFKSNGVASDSSYNSEDEQSNTIDVASETNITDFGAFKKDSSTETSKPQYRPVYLSSNAITLSNQIQIVIRFYGEPNEIHDNYDYVHCTNYWTSKDRKVVLNQMALESLLSKELFYVGSQYPITSIIRSRKFIKRGWNINAGQYLKMAYQVSKLNLDDIRVLEDQLIGVDTAYFNMLIHALQEKKKSIELKNRENPLDTPEVFTINFGYLVTIIDKLF